MADNWRDSYSRTRPCLDSVNIIQDTQTMAVAAATTTTTTNTSGGTGANNSLHMMGLRLLSQSPPQSLDWNQALFRGDQKSDNGFLSLLHDQDNSLSINANNFQLENNQWIPQRMHPAISRDSLSDFKQTNVRGFQLDQPEQGGDNEGIISCRGLNSSFQNLDLYGSPSTMMQSLFGSDNNKQEQKDSGFDQNQGMCCSIYQSNYGNTNLHAGCGRVDGGDGVGGLSGQELSTCSWPKFPPQPQQLGVITPLKPLLADMCGNQLHFANNMRFWNVSAYGVNNIRSSISPSLQMQLPLSSFQDKPKITCKVVKEITSELSIKRPQNKNQLTLPAIKVKKEKMGDRINALQQLLSPFGKTDTASVLSETTEYIKFLHEQVSVLSTPYMKKRARICQQPRHTPDEPLEGRRKDLRSRGLCLVPVSSTFPLTQETSVDFWTPTFGGTFR